jgi:hypothetical protein
VAPTEMSTGTGTKAPSTEPTVTTTKPTRRGLLIPAAGPPSGPQAPRKTFPSTVLGAERRLRHRSERHVPTAEWGRSPWSRTGRELPPLVRWSASSSAHCCSRRERPVEG